MNYSLFYILKNKVNFRYIYSPKIRKRYIKFVVLTISNACNINHRLIQRYFRSSFYNDNIFFIFLLGKNKCRNIINHESKLYKDILYINIINNYFNITLMFLNSINWINENFLYDYILKWDDDIVVNFPLLNLFINIQNHTVNYCGYFYHKTKICRNKSRICYIPFFAYRYTYLPPFIASGLLILSKYVSINIYRLYRSYKPYMIRDDQYLGALCSILTVKPIGINRYYNRRGKCESCIRRYISYHSYNAHELYALYKMISY